ncbi:MAG: peptidoglycan DD-metalloendopeptidase family protein [Cyanobacteriota bacterium]
MVSNMDTDLKVTKDDNMHNEVANQSEDEILDYLMGQSTHTGNKDKNKNFDSLRATVNKNHEKSRSNPEKVVRQKANSTPVFDSISQVSNSITKFLFEGVELSIARIKLAYNLTSQVSDIEFLLPLKTFVEKLHSTTIVNVNFTPEQVASIKTKQKLLNEKLRDKATQTAESLGVQRLFAFETISVVSNLVVTNFPKYKKAFVSFFVVFGCGLLAIASQFAVNNNNKQEDLLDSRKLAAVNWNVNGHVTEIEKDNIKSLISSGQIKVLPKGKISNSNIQLITNSASLPNKSLSPDDSLMLISSNSITHTVYQGESILSISQKYKVSISDLISSNPDTDLINIKPGDKLDIPNTMEAVIEDTTRRPSRVYSKIPRNLLASRSMSSTTRNETYNYISTSTGGRMLWPLPASRKISSRYGPRWGGFHPGIDITAPTGTPIVATRDGVVISSGWEGGYGKCVIIDHGNGISTRYAHASALLVSAGQAVTAGQIIARLGSTGWSTGPHLHYEVLVNGRHNNPMSFF